MIECAAVRRVIRARVDTGYDIRCSTKEVSYGAGEKAMRYIHQKI
jgi:hypothetical protein